MNLSTLIPDRLNLIVISLFLLLILSFAGIVVFSLERPNNYNYQYKVTAEQVSSSSYDIESSKIVNYNELSSAEQELLHKAYSDQSDGLLETGAETVEVSKKLELDEDPQWKVVEIKGVRLLMSISFDGSVADNSDTQSYMLTVSLCGIITSMFGLITMSVLKNNN